jgi:hypothetical protein
MEKTKDIVSDLKKRSRNCKWLMRGIFFDGIRDSCCCPYSINGCSGITRFLGGLFPTWSHRSIHELVQRLAAIMKVIFDPKELEPQGCTNGKIAPCILRFITCRSLDVSHTCIHEKHGGFEPDEIREIQDEEKFSIQRLDQLSTNFISKYKELPLCLPDFLTGYW